ncbi:MAG: YlxM family DNA-binding protein [Halanaerobiales bacterium]
MLEKTIEITLLFDYYGRLLTDKQQEIFNLYYYQDLSLAEIAEKLEISRQAVHDHLQRGEKILANYENKLGLAGRADRVRRRLEDVINLLENDNLTEKTAATVKNKLRKIKQHL